MDGAIVKYLSELSKKITEYKINRNRRKKPYIISGKYGIYYIVFPDSALDFHLVANGILNDWVATKLHGLIPQNGTIFDIGANVGLLTLPFAKLYVPQGIVYAFEPDFQNVCQLQINKEINQFNNVVVLPVALQNDPKTEQITFYIRRAIDGDGLINRGLSTLQLMPIYNIKEEKVFSSTIDIQVEKYQIPKVHFIKIDVEGSEFKVMQGGEQTLKNHHPIVVYEYSTKIDELSNSKNSVQSFEFMQKLGYKQYQIVQEKNLLEMTEPSDDMPDSNVVCFHKSKIPAKIL